MIIRRILSNRDASSTVDFAFALPVLIAIMLGTIQMGIYLHASGAIRHALGEGIRLAKVYPDATSAEVKTEVLDSMAALDKNKVTGFAFVRGTSGGIKYGAVAMRYQLEPMFPLVPLPAINITETRAAYLPAGS